MDLKSKIILIYGPTASGKSNFAIKLAKKINGEKINQMKELPMIGARTSVGKKVEVKIWRDKKEIVKIVTLGRL